MAQISVGIRMDKTLKSDFERICGELGLTMTAAFNVFARAVSRHKAIPFSISTENDANADGGAGAIAGEELSEIGAFTVDETAGGGRKWANPALARIKKSAWAESAAAKERQRKRVGR